MKIFKDTCLKCLRRNNYMSYVLVSSIIVVIYINTAKYSDGAVKHVQDFFSKQRGKELKKESKNKNEVEQYLKFYNQMGHAWTNLQTYKTALQIQDESFKKLFLSRSLRAKVNYLKSIENENSNSSGHFISEGEGKRVTINVATVACSKSTFDVMVLLKSAVMFSRDASLHVIIFVDNALPVLAELVLELKWTINSLGWDFTYELLQVWFPPEKNKEWKKMYALCATQRLFFTSLLPHIDSLIYLDADSIIVSNLTNFWNQFQRMNESHIAGIAPNTEFPANGIYNLRSKVPYYGKRGLNAGILIMNLTRMRNVDFENKALATYTLYKEKIQIADQDILNIMFHAFPEKLLVLDCTYNLLWAHCGEPGLGAGDRICLFEDKPGPICFCSSSLRNGIHVVHGNMGTFHKHDYPLFQLLYRTMSEFKLTEDSYSDLLSRLIQDFNYLDRPCFGLTGEKMYENALTYFQNLKLL